MGAEIRILILSNRDQHDLLDEPPLGPREDPHAGRPEAAGVRALVRADSVAPAAANVFATLAATPGVRVAHRAVFRPSEVVAALGEHRPSVVVNLCEALGGDSRREAHVAWLLERLGICFTGSPYHALRASLHKTEANRVLARAGVRVPATVRADSPDRIPEVGFPAIVKPEREDGSVGIANDSVVFEPKALRDKVAAVIETLGQPAVVQRYVHGRELSVSLLGWPAVRALPPGEIAFAGLPQGYPHILTFASKWHPESIECTGTVPVAAVLRPPAQRRALAAARQAFGALGLRDYGRVDMRLDERGVPWVIDVNPNCDLAEGAGFAFAAARGGLSYAGLLWEILRCALARRPDASALFASRGRSPRVSRAPALVTAAPEAS